MVSQKRKTVSTLGPKLFKKPRTVSKVAEEAEIKLKKPQTVSKVAEEAETKRDDTLEEKNAEKKSVASAERELVAARKTELKAMFVEDLKELLVASGLPTGKKEDMISALSSFEAKARAAVRDQEAKVRGVVVRKKSDLEALTPQELKDLCDGVGIKGVLSKQSRVELYLTWWQENKGVDNALAKVAHDLREEQLCAMDKVSLRKLCDKVRANPFVTEIMIERILREESALGRFSRPTEEAEEEEDVAPPKKGDLVDALLALEAQRKKAASLKARQEEEAALKRNELRSMNMEALKKTLASKGLEATGKKEDMVEALFEASVQEDALAARKTKLRSLNMDDLKRLCLRRRLGQDGKRDDMVEAIIAQEAKSRQEIRAYAAKLLEVMATKREEMEAKPNAELKELLASRGLPMGRAKDDWVESLLSEAKESGEIDALLSTKSRNARKGVLLSMDEVALQKLCADLSIDPFVKEVMVERIIAHESEVGAKSGAKPMRGSKK